MRSRTLTNKRSFPTFYNFLRYIKFRPFFLSIPLSYFRPFSICSSSLHLSKVCPFLNFFLCFSYFLFCAKLSYLEDPLSYFPLFILIILLRCFLISVITCELFTALFSFSLFQNAFYSFVFFTVYRFFQLSLLLGF